MITTGIIRKIDELGRIVIPKEIRKNLNIKNNDDLEIFIEQDKIILKKYNKMNNLKKDLSNYIEIINDYTSFTVLITDLEKVLLSSKGEYLEIIDENITNSFLTLIKERKNIIVNNINNIQITNKMNLNTKYAVIPLIIDANLLGSFIIISNEEITEKSLLVINIIIKIIRNNWIC